MVKITNDIGQVFTAVGTPLTLRDLERSKNSALYGQWLTDEEMKIEMLKDTETGKILYG